MAPSVKMGILSAAFSDATSKGAFSDASSRQGDLLGHNGKGLHGEVAFGSHKYLKI
jgi:hypothetical protein